MLDLIAESFPHLIASLRRNGYRGNSAAQLILAARYGQRATAWTADDCKRARAIVRGAFLGRRYNQRVRLNRKG